MKLEIEVWDQGYVGWRIVRSWFWRYSGAVAAYEAARRNAAEGQRRICLVALHDHQGRVVRRSRWGEEF